MKNVQKLEYGLQLENKQVAHLSREFFYTLHSTLSMGYTLTELLIVIAVIGVLAAVTIGAINPIEYFNRGRDSQRQQQVNNFAKALATYYINNRSVYPPADANWVTALVNDKAITAAPDTIGGVTTPCVGNIIASNYCYNTANSNADAVVYTALQSKSVASTLNCSASTTPMISWHSTTEKITTECGSKTVALTP